MNKNLVFRPRDPHGEIRAGILRRIPAPVPQMVGWRLIWWQKGWTCGPLGFRPQLAHICLARRKGYGKRGTGA